MVFPFNSFNQYFFFVLLNYHDLNGVLENDKWNINQIIENLYYDACFIFPEVFNDSDSIAQ